MSWLSGKKLCRCKNTELIQVGQKQFKKCKDCGREYFYATVMEWVLVDTGTIEKEKTKK